MLKTWLLDCATARELELDDHRPRAARRVLDAVARRRAICISSPARKTPDELIADIEDGFYVTDLIGMGVNLRDRRLQPRRVGVLDRERRAHLSGERGHDRRTSHRNVRAALTPANDLEFRYGTNAPTVRVEGLTVAGH